MTTVSLTGLTKVKISKRQLTNTLKEYKGVKTYDDFGYDEYKVYTYFHGTIAAIDINTNEIYINTKLFFID